MVEQTACIYLITCNSDRSSTVLHSRPLCSLARPRLVYQSKRPNVHVAFGTYEAERLLAFKGSFSSICRFGE